MTIEQYIQKYLDKRVDYDWNYGYQCVDLVRHFFKYVYGVELPTFWGSAKTGWLNKNNTFSSEFFDKIEWCKDLEAWDIIFFEQWKYGHVWIVEYVFEGWFSLLDQNWGKWSWTWHGEDRIQIRPYVFDIEEEMQNILWVWRYKFKWWENFDQKQKEIMKKALDLWYWNGKNPNDPVTRAEMIFMLMKK